MSIHITSIVPPESGWPIAVHCKHCRKTVIMLSAWAAKPSDGDYQLLMGMCVDEPKHNLYPQFDYPNPSRLGPRPDEWTAVAYAAYWNPRGIA